MLSSQTFAATADLHAYLMVASPKVWKCVSARSRLASCSSLSV